MTKSLKYVLLIVIVAIILALIFQGKNDNKNNLIKIGVINPTSGPAGNIGEEVANVIKLASSTALEIIYEDDQCDSKKAISAYQKLNNEGTKIFYVSCSGSVMALAPLIKKDGNLLVTGYAGSSEIRKTGDEVIRFIPDALSVSEPMSGYVKDKVSSSSTIGLLYEEQDYSKSVAMSIEEYLGKDRIISERYNANDTTFRTQIAKLKSQKIDTLLFVPTSDKAAELVYKEMDLLGFRPLIIGDVNACDYPIDTKSYKLSMICFKAGFDVETQAYKDFVKSYKDAYSMDASFPFYDAVTYDIILAINNFYKDKPRANISDLKNHIIGGVKGIMSDYNFTKDGEVLSGKYLKLQEK
jgi:ABC-type branched-subunit amino acid transport system substrate-binding protein